MGRMSGCCLAGGQSLWETFLAKRYHRRRVQYASLSFCVILLVGAHTHTLVFVSTADGQCDYRFIAIKLNDMHADFVHHDELPRRSRIAW
jgi:hypothetical protein